MENHGSCLVLVKKKLPAAKPYLIEASQYPARGTEGAKQDTVNSIFSYFLRTVEGMAIIGIMSKITAGSWSCGW